jgi:hypothetical protein
MLIIKYPYQEITDIVFVKYEQSVYLCPYMHLLGNKNYIHLTIGIN